MTGFTPELVERDAVVRFIREAAYTAWEDRPEGQLFLSLAKDIENEEHLHFVECRPAASGIAELTEALREAVSHLRPFANEEEYRARRKGYEVLAKFGGDQ
jgi:hypothetical protein